MSDVMIPICLISPGKNLLTVGALVSTARRLARGAGRGLGATAVAALVRAAGLGLFDVARLAVRDDALAAASLTALDCVGPASKF